MLTFLFFSVPSSEIDQLEMSSSLTSTYASDSELLESDKEELLEEICSIYSIDSLPITYIH